MDWMLWTMPTAWLFVSFGVLLIVMTVWEVLQPSSERRGFIIPMVTTRGDRLFIALLIGAVVCAFWVATALASMWWVVVITCVLIAVLMRWG